MTTIILIKSKIESLFKEQQLKILQILLQNNETVSENRNGSFINLNKIKKKTIMEIEEYLEYIKTQEQNLNKTEITKIEIKKLLKIPEDTNLNTSNFEESKPVPNFFSKAISDS